MFRYTFYISLQNYLVADQIDYFLLSLFAHSISSTAKKALTNRKNMNISNALILFPFQNYLVAQMYWLQTCIYRWQNSQINRDTSKHKSAVISQNTAELVNRSCFGVSFIMLTL